MFYLMHLGHRDGAYGPYFGPESVHHDQAFAHPKEARMLLLEHLREMFSEMPGDDLLHQTSFVVDEEGRPQRIISYALCGPMIEAVVFDALYGAILDREFVARASQALQAPSAEVFRMG